MMYRFTCTVFYLTFLLLLEDAPVDAGKCYSRKCMKGHGCQREMPSKKTLHDCCQNELAGYAEDGAGMIGPDCYLCKTCKELLKPVDGNWGTWGLWNECSKTCGGGTQESMRICDSPPPSNNGKPCEGNARQTRDCERHECIVNGNWGAWAPWSKCSRTCGEGRQQRTRECDNPPPSSNGQPCQGQPQIVKSCQLDECVVDGNWGTWGTWSMCSKTCGEGRKQRMRVCDNPPPSKKGKGCQGNSLQTNKCYREECIVNGNWGAWGPWSGCSKTCGVGRQVSMRECDNPPPSSNGKACQGQPQQTKECRRDPCIVHGGWTKWSAWNDCVSLKCELKEGFRVQSRACANPAPAYNGRMCRGPFFHKEVCVNPTNCAVDGGWSIWNWTCTENAVISTRECNNPAPKNGGNDCGTGVLKIYQLNDPMYKLRCKDYVPEDKDVDGGWSQWVNWRCYNAVAKATRECNNPAPKRNGKPCEGSSVVYRLKGSQPYLTNCPNGRQCNHQSDDEDGECGSGSGNGSGNGSGDGIIDKNFLRVNGK